MAKNDEENSKNSKKNVSKRCHCCKKKSLLLTVCKCGHSFCIKHRYPDEHNCCYDFKKENLPELVDCNFKKIDKI
tara:strand:- start:1100 stop:1324 length:225 start_codon:yes stop_codon:yes gene_type:complete